MAAFLLLFLSLLTFKSNGDTCSKTSQQCSIDGDHCTANSVKISYPDVKTLFATDKTVPQSNYNCHSADYCKWGQMWEDECIRIYREDMMVPGAFKFQGECIVLEEVPITINASISCCQDSFDCNSVFDAIEEPVTESLYATQNCVEKEDVGIVVESVAKCYASKEFMTYIQCNKTQYVDQCPPFFFYNLQTYARCACQSLIDLQSDESLTSDVSDAYLYFSELTKMVEGIFQTFREEKSENCPNYVFSCNAAGEAQLDLYEIICPLVVYDDTDFDVLKNEINAGVGSLEENQTVIYAENDIIRVLMYSEEDAFNALDWLNLNVTDTTPDEVGSPCTMKENIWNLVEEYGDYVPPTPAPTDGCVQSNVFVVALFVFYHCVFRLNLV